MLNDDEDIEQELEEEASNEMPKVQNRPNYNASNLMRGLSNINSKNKNDNNENNGVINQAKDKAGKATENVGKGVKAAGQGMEAVGKGAEVAGKGMQAAGKGMEAAGSGLSAAGNALSSTGVGAVAGVPLSALGGVSKAAGKGTEAAGKGTENAGKGMQKAGQSIKKSGEGIKQAGGLLQNKKDKDKSGKKDKKKKKRPLGAGESLVPTEGSTGMGFDFLPKLIGINPELKSKNPLMFKAQIAIRLAIPIMLILLIFILVIIAVIVGFTAITGSSSCDDLQYNASGGDTTNFLCSMTSPYGSEAEGREYTVTGLSGRRIPPATNMGHGSNFHKGIDLTGVHGKSLTGIYAVADGKVETAGMNGAYGNMVLIKHGSFYTRYAHLSSISSGVTAGSTVKQGDKIGVMGATGNVSGVHLHFELLDSNMKYVSANPFFGYSDQGYEECLNENGSISNERCDFSTTGSARRIGQEGFTQVCGVRHSNSTTTSSDCCSSYSSNVSGDNVSGLPTILTQEFVNGSIQAQSEYGVPASLTLAQIVIESRGSYPGNQSGLAYRCKNLFGIKGTGSAGSCTFGTSEQTSSGTSYTISAGFRKYNTYSESINDHGRLLASSTYSRCTSSARTSQDWARAIKQCGYATDTQYAQKLISVMDQYNLYQYDDQSVFGSGTNECTSTTNGSGSNNIVQRALEEYDKWNSVSSMERSEMLKNYIQACGNSRACLDWCAGFVSYILQETGKLSGINGYNCMARSYSNVTQKAGSSVTVTHHSIGSGYTPQPGDVVVFGNRHVGLVEKTVGNTIYTIEGNTSGAKTASCHSGSIGKHANPRGSRGMTEFVTIR